MYSDLSSLEIAVVKNDKEVKKLLNKIRGDKLIKVGFDLRDMKNKNFDQDFYRIAGIDFKKRWGDFKVIRNNNNEEKLFEELNLKSTKYVFLHDDPSRKYKIDEKYIINKNWKIIKPFKTKNIFDWCKVLEKAGEIHCIDSSFRLLADSLTLTTSLLFFHQTYINKDSKYVSSSKQNWKII
jgi:hypothetical protein